MSNCPCHALPSAMPSHGMPCGIDVHHEAARHGMAWHGMAWHGMACHAASIGVTSRLGMARHGEARQTTHQRRQQAAVLRSRGSAVH